MNKNQLNRILNKLTAAVPYQDGAPGTPDYTFTYQNPTNPPGPGQSFIPDYINTPECTSFRGHNFFTNLYFSFQRLSTQQRYDRNVVVRLFFGDFNKWMEAFCLCMEAERMFPQSSSESTHANYAAEAAKVEAELNAQLDDAIPWWSLLPPPQSGPASPLVPSAFDRKQRVLNWQKRLQIMKKLFKKCQELIRNRLTDPSNKSCEQFDYSSANLTAEELTALSDSIAPGELSPLVDTWEWGFSPENDPVTGGICAEPKVEIIEDYLVEQGLAIGVAGILTAAAIGLFLRRQKAAAVALIAAGTAAVGGTAAGAEGVMNDVDADYTRSVRFGGQQDCRNSNQTGSEMSEGD